MKSLRQLKTQKAQKKPDALKQDQIHYQKSLLGCNINYFV